MTADARGWGWRKALRACSNRLPHISKFTYNLLYFCFSCYDRVIKSEITRIHLNLSIAVGVAQVLFLAAGSKKLVEKEVKGGLFSNLGKQRYYFCLTNQCQNARCKLSQLNYSLLWFCHLSPNTTTPPTPLNEDYSTQNSGRKHSCVAAQVNFISFHEKN